VRVPELPPAPDAAAVPPSLGAAVWSWVVGVDGRVSGRRVLGLCGGRLAVLVVVVVAWRAFVVAGGGGAGPPPELTLPRASSPASSSSGGSSSSSDGTSSPDGGTGSAPGVVVHVAGAVVRPGVYRLGGSPRVADAVDAAGGPAPDADLDAVNLAAPVADGERVYLPRRGEPMPPSGVETAGAVTAATAGPLDLNAATAEQLDALPGVGPSTAAAILAYRQEHGRFRSVDELLEVRGIGEAKLADLRSKVRVR
jgi:competence protein ComEA